MNIINFYNRDRKLEMFFSDIKFEINEPDFHNFISFQIAVQHSFIQASINTECLDIDFEHFLADLQKLYRMEVKTVSFIQTIEKNIEINLKLTEFGNIIVQVIMQKQIDSVMLQFEYGIDQSFLPELMGEISTVLKSANINLQ